MTTGPTPSEPQGSTGLPTAVQTPAVHALLTNERRQAMHRVLSERDGELGPDSRGLADKYLGALFALHRPENPECLPQAAHSMRELIEALPVAFDVPSVDYDALVPRIRILVESWKRIEADGPENAAGNERRFQEVMRAFAGDFQAVGVARREQAEATIIGMDVSGRNPPPEIQDLRVREFLVYRTYFVQSCHHGSTTREEFVQMLDAFERFILDYRWPDTYEDIGTLRHIIEEGERHA